MLTGKTLGGFAIQEEVGRGAMGVVFKARQISMDRVVALKFLPKRMAEDPKVVARFVREARAAGQLTHPNIVSVHDVGVAEGLHYIAMEFVDGYSVQRKIKQSGALTESETLDIATQITEALKLAHGRGILHRDIKPDNFLMDKTGRVRLADLGLAHFEGRDESKLTQDGTTLGTPHYMSPEQCSGGEVTARSDLYSLGVSMFVMASDRTPFEGNTAAAVMVKVLTQPPLSLSKLRSELSAGFVAVVEKLMAKDPAARFASAQQLADALLLCKKGGYKVTAAHRSVPSPRRRKADPVRSVAYSVGAAIAAVLLLAAFAPQLAGKAAPVQPAKAALPEKSVQASPAAAATAPAQPAQLAKDDPTKTPAAKPPAADSQTQHPAWPAFAKIKANIEQHIARNPAGAMRALHEFQTQHPDAPVPMQAFIAEQITKSEQAQQQLARDWRNREADANREFAAGRCAAFSMLTDFQQAHTGSAEGGKAGELRAQLLEKWRQSAKAATAATDFNKARQMLRDASARVPAPEAALLNEDLKACDESQKAHEELAELNTKAAAKALEADATGTPYRFAAAAQICRDGAARLKNTKAQEDAATLAKIYDKAADVLTRMRARVNEGGASAELPNLGSFKAGRLTVWDDQGWSFVPAAPANGLGEQRLAWKQITPNHLLRLAQQVPPLEQTGAENHFALGALAFAAGTPEAAENLKEAAKDTKLAPLTEVPLHLIKLPAKAAPQAPPPATPVATPTPLAPPAPAVANKEKAPSKEAEKKDDSAAVKEELKKAGWTQITGNWTREGAGRYRVKDGGTLACATVDADIQTAFTLDDDASVGVYVHYERMGYGVSAHTDEVIVLGDRSGGFAGPPRRKGPRRLPIDLKFADPHARHQVNVSAREEKLVITVDGKEAARSNGALREGGDARIVVTGNALLETPVVRK